MESPAQRPIAGSIATTRRGRKDSWIAAAARIVAPTRRSSRSRTRTLRFGPSIRPVARGAQGKAGDASARRGVACGQYVRQPLEPCGLDQAAEEEKTHHAMLRAILSGHGSESAVVHGFQRPLRHRRRQAMRSVHHHRRASLRAQQSRFDNFRYVFNNERPHAGLNNQVPARLYLPSSIRLPRKLPEFTYPKGLLLRRVNNSGDISWHKNRIFISEVFRFEKLTLELIPPGFYRVFFRKMNIGEFNAEELRFRAARRVV